MAGKVTTICENALTSVIQELGYDLVEVEYVKKSDGMNLTFYIDCDKGIDINDCEKVSKVIDPILDELNPTMDEHYILNVSSLGIDRPLKTDRDFKRNLGKEISVTTFAKIDGEKKFDGVLVSFDERTITLQIKEQQKVFDREKIAHIVPIIKF